LHPVVVEATVGEVVLQGWVEFVITVDLPEPETPVTQTELAAVSSIFF